MGLGPHRLDAGRRPPWFFEREKYGGVYVDIAGRAGGNHLFLVDAKATRHEDASGVERPYGRQLVADIENRTETAMSQRHCVLACQLALEAEAKAVRLC